MENLYYFISDNVTEITSMIDWFKKLLSISLSAKYLRHLAYNISFYNLVKKNTFDVFNKFKNIQRLFYIQHTNPDMITQLSNLTRLKDLAINYIYCDIVHHLDLRKLNKLISFGLMFDYYHDSHNIILPKSSKYIFNIESTNLQKLTLQYCHFQCITTLINCPKLTYLYLAQKTLILYQSFDIKYSDMVFNLQDLILEQVDFDIEQLSGNYQFEHLTYLRMERFYRNLCLTHLHKLKSLFITETHRNITIANLNCLKRISLFSCNGKIKIHNLIKLPGLHLFQIQEIEMSSIDKLKIVTLSECNKCCNLQFLKMTQVKNLNIDNIQYDENVEERLKQFESINSTEL